MTYEPLVKSTKKHGHPYTIVVLTQGEYKNGTHELLDQLRVLTIAVDYFDVEKLREIRGTSVLNTYLDAGIRVVDLQEQIPSLYEALCNAMARYNGQFIRFDRAADPG